MKTLSLTISFILFSLTVSFSQCKLINHPDNDKIINYILQGKYKKVITLTTSAHFENVILLDTNSISYLLYNHQLDSQEVSVFINYMARLKNVLNVQTISKAISNPKNLSIDIATNVYDDASYIGIDVPNTKYGRRVYIINDGKYTYSLIIAFINLKLVGISIQIDNN